MAGPRPIEPPRVPGNAGGTGFQNSALIRNMHDDNVAPLTSVAGAPDDPRVSGDLAGYNARYTAAMAPLRQQAADTQAQATQLYATQGRFSADARNAETDALIQRSNADNATPDFASPTGQFVPGDLEGYVRQRAIDSRRELDQAVGNTPLTPAQEQAVADQSLADLKNRPNDRYMTFHQADQEVKNNRRLANGRQQIEQAVPGKTGKVLGQAYEMAGGLDPAGMAGAARNRITSLRGSPKPPAPATPCATCRGAGAAPAAPPPAPPAAAPAAPRAAPPKLGDLSPAEIAKIQKGAETLGGDIYVAGSAAKGTRRGVGTDLPLVAFGGSKKDTKSDIDYMVAPHLDDKATALGLPDVDGSWGVRGVNTVNLDKGPVIRFSPGKEPEFVSGTGKLPIDGK